MQILQDDLTAYELTNDEVDKAHMLSSEQIAYYRNEINRLAHTIIAFKFNLADPLPGLTEVISMQNQISVYKSILLNHAAVIDQYQVMQ
jgi:hypothetical protein